MCVGNKSPADGVAMISYNVYPGWHLRRMIRDMMLYHIRAIDDPREQIRQARSLVRFLLETASEGSFYRMVLEEQAQAIQNASDGYLFHDHLEMDNHPVYFYEFVNRAETAGLKYLGETKLSAMLSKSLPSRVQHALAGGPLIQHGQYLDFFRNTSFRKSLLCHSEIRLDRNLDGGVLQDYYLALDRKPAPVEIDLTTDCGTQFSLPQGRFLAQKRLVKAAILYLAEIWPRSTSFRTLYEAALHRFPGPAQQTEDCLDENSL